MRCSWATVLGLVSAIGYTAANVALRSVSDCDPIWVSAVKSIPTLLGALAVLVWQTYQNHSVWPSRTVLWRLIVAAFVGNFFGNVAFQWALGVIGIALSVPLVLGTIIVSGTAMGRWLLGEPVSRRTLTAVVLLVAAVGVLSLGAESAHRSVVQQAVRGAPHAWMKTALGVAAAIVAGTAYSVLSVVIRYGVQRQASVSVTMFVVSLVGLVSLSAIALVRGGPQLPFAFTFGEYTAMTVAGLFNALAFLALTRAYQLAHMVYINAINGSQAAMAALAGVWLFREAPTPALWTGLALTVGGLWLLDRRA